MKREIVKEPVPQTIAYGTRSTISRGGQNLRFSRSLTVVATAYTHTGNRTYSGTVPKVGTVAVDPRVIPLGSQLYVEGYGLGRALDVGRAIKGHRLDVFRETEQQAQRWGRKTVRFIFWSEAKMPLFLLIFIYNLYSKPLAGIITCKRKKTKARG